MTNFALFGGGRGLEFGAIEGLLKEEDEDEDKIGTVEVAIGEGDVGIMTLEADVDDKIGTFEVAGEDDVGEILTLEADVDVDEVLGLVKMAAVDDTPNVGLKYLGLSRPTTSRIRSYSIFSWKGSWPVEDICEFFDLT